MKRVFRTIEFDKILNRLCAYTESEQVAKRIMKMDMLSFDEKVKDADLVITGEGKMDSQSLMGKLPFGVAKRCSHTRVAAIVGLNVADEKLIKELGIAQVVETNPEHKPFDEVRASAREDLVKAAKKIII